MQILSTFVGRLDALWTSSKYPVASSIAQNGPNSPPALPTSIFTYSDYNNDTVTPSGSTTNASPPSPTCPETPSQKPAPHYSIKNSSNTPMVDTSINPNTPSKNPTGLLPNSHSNAQNLGHIMHNICAL
jgi:hypothetical protein